MIRVNAITKFRNTHAACYTYDVSDRGSFTLNYRCIICIHTRAHYRMYNNKRHTLYYRVYIHKLICTSCVAIQQKDVFLYYAANLATPIVFMIIYESSTNCCCCLFSEFKVYFLCFFFFFLRQKCRNGDGVRNVFGTTGETTGETTGIDRTKDSKGTVSDSSIDT